MKKILICIQFLLLTTVAYATGQDSDVIYINGTRWALLDRPVCRDSLLYHHLKAVLLQNTILLQPTGMASPHIGALRRTYSTSTVYDVNTMI